MAAENVAAALARIPAHWRRRAVVAAALLGAWALAGFLLVPWVVQHEVLPAASRYLGRPLEAARVEFNPFVLSARVTGLRLLERPGGPVLVGADEVFVNLQTSSLFRRAWTFAEIRLRTPYVHVARDRAGDLNLLHIVPPSPPAPPEPPSPPPRLLIQRFALEGGLVDVDDAVPATPFHTRLGPLQLNLQEFSTLPDATGRQSFSVTLESGAKIGWAGTVGVNPLDLAGEFHLAGPVVPLAWRYLRDELNFGLSGGDLRLDARYRVSAEADGRYRAAITELRLEGAGIHLRAQGAESDFLTLPEFHLAGGSFRWPEQEVHAAEFVVTGLHVAARRLAGGELDVARLLAPRESAPVAAAAEKTEAPPTPPAQPEKTWRVALDRVELKGLGFDLRDESLRKPGSLSVTDLDVALANVSNEPGARFDLQASLRLGGGGMLAAKGAIGVLPDPVVEADLQLDALALPQLQPWVTEAVPILVKAGTVGMTGHLSSAPAEAAALQADVRVAGLDVDDVRKDERLLAWKELALDDLKFRAAGRSLRISRVRLAKPYARVFIAKDKTTNYGDLLREEPAPVAADGTANPAAPAAATPAPAPKPAAARATDPPGGSAPPPFAVRVGRVEIADGAADFTDLSLPLPFAAHITKLNGRLTALDTRSLAPSQVNLEGQVGEYGLARIDGQLRPSAPMDLADIAVVFRNIDLAPFSSYSLKFAGYRIAGGKLNLDLRYRFDQRRMDAQNRIVLDQLELGEKVPNPDAVDLPLGLAIALLKDADGRIDIDLPVTGSVDDPQFSIGRVVWKALVTLITKAVTSPFRLLGQLVGMDSEKFGQIEFAPGRSDLRPPDLEVLHKISEALAKRPKLAVEVPAVVEPGADTAALQAARVEALVAAQLGEAGGRTATGGRDLEQRTRRALEDLWSAQFPDQSLRDQRDRYTGPPADDPKGKSRLDEVAYVDALRRQLAGAQPVAAADLDALGTARAASVVQALGTASPEVASRVKTGARRDAKAGSAGGIPMELQLGTH